MALINSLNNENLDIAKKGVVVEELTATLDFNDDAFIVTSVGNNKVNVEIDTNILQENSFKRVATAVDYTTQAGDTYIGVDSTNEVTITLAAGEYEGQTIIIKDETGNSNSRKITVLPTSPDLIDDKDEIQLASKYIAIQLVYIASNNQWRII
jgi:hypothetical protein